LASKREEQVARVVSRDLLKYQRLAQGGDQPKLAAEPCQDPFAVLPSMVAPVDLGLAKPEHRAPKLLGHLEIVQDLGLKPSFELDAKLVLVVLVQRRDSLETQIARVLGYREAEATKSAGREDDGARIPVDLPRDLVKDLVDHVRSDVARVDRRDGVALRERGDPEQGTKLGAVVRYGELHCRSTALDEVREVFRPHEVHVFRGSECHLNAIPK